MARAEINGISLTFETPQELVEFLKLYGATVTNEPSEPAREPNSQNDAEQRDHVFKARNRSGGNPRTVAPRVPISDEAFDRLLNTLRNDDGVKKIQATQVFEPFGIRGPKKLSGAMKDVAERIESKGFKVSDVIAEVRRGGVRSMAPGPMFNAFFDLVTQRRLIQE